MKAAKLSTSLKVQIDGFKAQWRTSKPEDSIAIEDMTFIRVVPYSYGLVKLTTASNPNAPPEAAISSLTSSIGLQNLIRMRNDARASMLPSLVKRAASFLMSLCRRRRE